MLSPCFLNRPSSLAMCSGMCTRLGGVVGMATMRDCWATAMPGDANSAAANAIGVRRENFMSGSLVFRPVKCGLLSVLLDERTIASTAGAGTECAAGQEIGRA